MSEYRVQQHQVGYSFWVGHGERNCIGPRRVVTDEYRAKYAQLVEHGGEFGSMFLKRESGGIRTIGPTEPPPDRLASLEELGIIWRESAPPPVAATLHHLTDAGADLRPVLDALGVWGVRFMSEQGDADQFRSHWFKRPVSLFLKDRAPDGPPVSIQLSPEDQPAVIEASREEIRTLPGTVQSPDLELAGPPSLILGVVSGQMSVKDAKAAGLTVAGPIAVLNRLRREPAATRSS